MPDQNILERFHPTSTSIYCKVAKIVKKVWTLPLVVKYQKQRIRFVEVGNVVTLLKGGRKGHKF